MKKYASQFNELIVLAEREKSKKKGGSMAAVLKLVQELADFESNIQEAIDAQEMTENRNQIEAFLADIDKMYEVLLSMAKASIQSMRSERSNVIDSVDDIIVDEEKVDEDIAPKIQEADPTRFTAEDLKRQLDSRPSSPISLTIPKAPR